MGISNAWSEKVFYFNRMASVAVYFRGRELVSFLDNG